MVDYRYYIRLLNCFARALNVFKLKKYKQSKLLITRGKIRIFFVIHDKKFKPNG